jgi:UV DNA damage endonuclease
MGAEINAVQHIWGYVSKDCSEAEKKRYVKLLEAFKSSTGTAQVLKNHLLKCARKRDIEYLKNSLYFYIKMKM